MLLCIDQLKMTGKDQFFQNIQRRPKSLGTPGLKEPCLRQRPSPCRTRLPSDLVTPRVRSNFTASGGTKRSHEVGHLLYRTSFKRPPWIPAADEVATIHRLTSLSLTGHF